MRILTAIASAFLMFACGTGTTNTFAPYEKDDPGQKAANKMEQGNPEDAIDILETALEGEPNNYEWISLLSAAYAQKHGVGMIDIALAMAGGSESTSLADSGGNELSKLWPILPDATSANLSGIDHAVDLLESIPSASRTNADNFKLGILSVVSVSMQLKALDTNGDGSLSVDELLNLDETNATTILSGLLGAVTATAAFADGEGGTGQAANQIGTIYDSIDSAEGETDAEKLQNYLQE